MKRFRLAIWGALAVAWAAPSMGAEPVRIIFDTDICGDCDDALALGMIHALESRGDCRLLAVTVSADHPLAGPMVDVLNTFYGRPGVPIGVVGAGGVAEESEFLDLVNQRDGGRYRYPHSLIRSSDAPPAVEGLRKTLAGQPDGSVVVVQVGFSTNLAGLLDSPPDAHSPLTGVDLVRKKVRLLSLMAGAFRAIDGDARYLEYNVQRDVRSAQKVAKDWPTPRVWSGFEIGAALPYPAASIERDYGYVEHHPVAEAYVRRNPPPHNRPTWDLTSVLHAVRPDREDFGLTPSGMVTVEPDGFTRFTARLDGRDRYLVLRPGSEGRITEALVQLSSQPPAAVKGRERTMSIYVDGDACPVKDEVYKVARRHQARVFVVSNAPIFVPKDELFEMVVVKGGFDSADDWIVEKIGPENVAVTTDIPLAGRCLEKGAKVLSPKGRPFTEDDIGDALATRALLEMLRQSGSFGGGPAPFSKVDRSRFLSKLDETLVALKRRRP